MIAGLPLGFAEPLVLIGLLILPVLWWLLRLIPPRPRRIDFPPTRLLLEIAPKEETPARAPWWLTLMRLALAALVIVAAAGPLWNPPLAAMKTRAPLAVLIDDGWTAASAGDAAAHGRRYYRARRERSPRGSAHSAVRRHARYFLAPAGSARVRLHQIKPQPHTVDRSEALPAIERFLADAHDVELVWLSDSIDAGHGADFVKALARVRRRTSVHHCLRRHARSAGADRGRQRGRRAECKNTARLGGWRCDRDRSRTRSERARARRGSVCV